MHMIENICIVVIWPLTKILPVKRFPEVAVVLIFLIIYIMIEFIVTVMNVFSAYTGLSHFMVGMTLMVWGSDNMEMLNLAIAISKGEEEMALIAVLSCQILCMTFVIPMACISRMVSRNQTQI